MSKIISKELKLESILLYRSILKLHIFKLNEDMRVFGDYFVKSEFTLNYKQADENQLKIFLNQWRKYEMSLKNMKNISDMNFEGVEKLKTKMDIDQKKSFEEIKDIISNKE